MVHRPPVRYPGWQARCQPEGAFDAGRERTSPRRVAVRVTDADNLGGSAEVLVRIHVTPEDDDDLPPVCKVKPWLPQCQEPMARTASLRRGQ